jgi:hypothetical protein
MALQRYDHRSLVAWAQERRVRTGSPVDLLAQVYTISYKIMVPSLPFWRDLMTFFPFDP